MKRALLEKRTVVVLFILVLVVFSIAEKDTKRVLNLYTRQSEQKAKADKTHNSAGETANLKPAQSHTARN